MFQIHHKSKTLGPVTPQDFLRQVPEYHTYRAVRWYFFVAYVFLTIVVLTMGIFLYESVFRTIETLPKDALTAAQLPKEEIDVKAFAKVKAFAELRTLSEQPLPIRNPFAAPGPSTTTPSSTSTAEIIQ